MFAAYGWDSSLSDAAILEGLLALNLEREAAQAIRPVEEPEEDEGLEEWVMTQPGVPDRSCE